MKRNRIKFFIVATMVAVLSINNAYGMSVEDAMADKPLDKPTLDQLNDEVSSSTYPRSGYNYVEQSASSGTTVTKHEIQEKPVYCDAKTGVELNDVTGLVEGKDYIILTTHNKTTIPHYYNVILNKTEYGTGTDNNIDFIDGVLNGTTVEYASSENKARIDNTFDITSETQGNWFERTSTTNGGAIYNQSSYTMGDIKGDFVGNSATTDVPSVTTYGGAISNGSGQSGDPQSTMGNITGNFIGNYAKSTNDGAYGGAIYNSDECKMEDITGDFIGNYVDSLATSGGGAIASTSGSTIGNITGDFIGNYACTKADGKGGAIYAVVDSIGNITGDFIGNYYISQNGSEGGAIYIYADSHAGNITGNFFNNYVKATNSSAQGGAIKIDSLGDSNISGLFVNNSAQGINFASGGAISNAYQLGIITGDFINNYVVADNGSSNAKAVGGAINNDVLINGIKGSFIGNYAKATGSDDSIAQGGAIYSNSDLKIIADNAISVFKDNYTELNGVKDDNAIYMNNSSSTLTFDMKNDGKVHMFDNIRGTDGYNVVIKGDGSDTQFSMFNDIHGANVTFDNTTINTMNGATHTYVFKDLNIASDIKFVGDVDLANKEMDKIEATGTVSGGGKLEVTGLNLKNDASETETKISFAEDNLKSNVENGVTGELLAPIYKYSTEYDDATGNFTFVKGARHDSGGDSGAFNPAVLATSVTAVAGATATMSQTFNNVFHHSDMFMNLPSFDRVSVLNSNKYALLDSIKDDYYSTPLLSGTVSTQGAWIRPYTSFENIPLNNGPNVRNITYGTLIGFDSNLDTLNNGWSRVFSGYVGYNGATQKYNDISTYQNGGLLGGTLTMYKGNFFNATTLAVGASVAENNTMYGRDNFTMLLAGLGNKTGYNIEFKDGKFIAQPNLFMGYTFVNTFDYTNAAGVNIHANPLNSLQIAPGIKFIGNLDGGWQPYASVSMVWDTMGKSTGKANNVRLPEMYIKPYVQYGVGLQKRFNDNCVAYGQAMIQNGGRNGISLTAGFRWALKNLFGIESI